VESALAITLDGAPGNDDLSGYGRFIGGPGSNTLDFAAAALPAALDLESTAVQTVDAAGHTVQLLDLFVNYVGSNFGDTLTVRSLPLQRNIDGRSHGTVLNFDALGQPATALDGLVAGDNLPPVVIANVGRVNWAGNTVADVTNLTRAVFVSPLRFNRRHRVWVQTVVLQNRGPYGVQGPLRVVVFPLRPRIRLANAAGITLTFQHHLLPPPGSPFVFATSTGGGVLDPLDLAVVTLAFRTSRPPSQIQYGLAVLAGPGQP
jgi:hypothetical protein